METFIITEPDKVTANIGPDLIVAQGDSVKLTLLTNLNSGGIEEIEWSGYDGLGGAGLVVEFVASTSSTIYAMISDTADCPAIDSMRLTVRIPRIIFIPNIVSPNDDGINDYFTSSGRFNLTNIGYLRIYDRWGNQLFEQNDLTPGNELEGWDGKFRGEPMAPGVYVYVAKLEYEDGYTETAKGEVTIVR
jgi:gliding motility-associated-like protein